MQWRREPEVPATKRMSASSVSITVAIFCAAALAVGAYIEAARPFASWDLRSAGAVLGSAVGVLVFSGAIPLTVWAFRKFSLARASGPLASWGVIGIVVSAASVHGSLFETEQKILRWSDQVVAGGEARDQFKTIVVSRCIRRQPTANNDHTIHASAEQIYIYCGCIADRTAALVEPAEIAAFARTNEAPPSLQAKIDRVTPACARTAAQPR